MYFNRLPPKYKVTFTDCDEASNHINELTTQDQSSKSQPSEVNPFYAELIGNERVTAADHWQDVRLLTFDIADSRIAYVLYLFNLLLPSDFS